MLSAELSATTTTQARLAEPVRARTAWNLGRVKASLADALDADFRLMVSAFVR
jgi:hypothetical protein